MTTSRTTGLFAALLCFSAAAAFAGMPENEPLDASPEFQRALRHADHATEDRAALATAMALVTPTPWADGGAVLEITERGNVAIPGRPRIVVIVGDTPASVIPEGCREDAKTYPRPTTLLCEPNDSLYRRAHGLAAMQAGDESSIKAFDGGGSLRRLGPIENMPAVITTP